VLGTRAYALASVLVVALAASGCGATTPAQQAPRAVHRASQVASAPRAVTSVVVVSIDALNPAAIRRLGRRGTPTLHRLVRRGASTMNARTERERTETLPNHTGMVTGRGRQPARRAAGPRRPLTVVSRRSQSDLLNHRSLAG